MVSLNDVLLAMSNIPVDDPIAEIWGRQMQGGYKIIEYTGAIPITINANGDALLDYRIYGADGGVGEPTENLYNKNDPDIVYSAYMNYAGTIIQGGYGDAVKVSGYIPINGGQTYTGTNLMDSESGNYYAYYDTNKQLLETGLVANNMVFNSPTNAAYIRTTLIHRNSEDVAMLVKGSTAPETYIPYGYKLPMTVASKNLFDKNAKDVDKGYVPNKVFNADGSLGPSSLYSISEYMQVEPLKEYFLENFHNSGWTRAYYCACFYDSNKNVLSVIKASDEDSLILLAPELARFIRLSVNFPTCKFYSSAPQTTPVYIGENQLGEDEYVSFSEQKIYRNVSGTLAPTDPPITFPDIPTIKGETVIDYDGEPKPSQMYVKYTDKG